VVPSLELYLPIINLLESRNYIIKNIIDNIDMFVNDEFNESLLKDNSIVENDYKILSYRVFFAILGNCYKIGILKDYIIEYILSNIYSNDEFVKLWINRAIVHFLIQSEFNIKTSDHNEKTFITNCIRKCLIGKSTKDKTEFCLAFKILLKSKTMPSEEEILKIFEKNENIHDLEKKLSEATRDEDILDNIDYAKIITDITSRINKTHVDDFDNYKDDFKVIIKNSNISDIDKCIAILNGLYDINIKSCILIYDFVIFLEQNINSFKSLFQSILVYKIDEINDIEIDNPSITDLVKLFI